MCSDGLHAVVPEQRLHEVLKTAPTPQGAVDQFITLTNDAGARDNVSCIIVDVLTCAAGEWG